MQLQSESLMAEVLTYTFFRVYLISHGQHLVLLLKGYRDMFTVSIFNYSF